MRIERRLADPSATPGTNATQRRRRSLAVGLRTLGVSLALVLAIGTLSPTEVQAATAGSLSVNRSSAVAGWPLTFKGRAPKSGKQKVTLQRYLNGNWNDLKSVATDNSGAFRIRHKQLAMPVEHYRVRGAGFATRQVNVTGIFQDVEITSSTSYPLPLATYKLYANVTPKQAGRVVKFYHANIAGGWDLVGESTTDGNGLAVLQVSGLGRFQAVAQPFGGACAYPSLALTLPAPLLAPLTSNDPESPVVLSPMPSSNHHSAEYTYRWWPTGENWGWEVGEGIPQWSKHLAGSGHVAPFVGMLSLLSGSYNNSIPSYGTTATTLMNAGHSYGRWEMRTRHRQYGTQSYTPYVVQLRLVQAKSQYVNQPTNAITIAQWRGYSDKTDHAVTKNGITYKYTSSGTARNESNFHNFAVELTRKHLTWLLDGKVVATAPASMLPAGTWVPQFVLKATDGVRMTAARISTDWVRYFPLGNKRALRLPVGPTPTLSTL